MSWASSPTWEPHSTHVSLGVTVSFSVRPCAPQMVGAGLLPIRPPIDKLLPRSGSVVDIQSHGTHELPAECRLSIQLPLKSRRVSVLSRFQGLHLVSEVLG